MSDCRSQGSKAECGRRGETQKSDHQLLPITKTAPKCGDTAGAGLGGILTFSGQLDVCPAETRLCDMLFKPETELGVQSQTLALMLMLQHLSGG